MPTVDEIDACTGCSACQAACPQHCISMEPGPDGFLNPQIDYEACTLCSICYRTCPTRVESTPAVRPTAYAAWSVDRATRFMSTSGGVFSELAHAVIAMQGAVVGARYDGPSRVRHDVARSVAELAALRQSKYVQSDKCDVFQQVLEMLDDGVPVLFVGSPCECAGLAQLIGGTDENLVMCDFICRGVCAPLAYSSYIRFLEQKHASRAVEVWFKHKGISWNRFSTRVRFANERVYSADRYHDLYMRGYLEANLFLRESCGNCPFKGASRVADITLADFWGVEHLLPEVDRSIGVSLVLVNTDRGERLVDMAADRIERIPVDFADALRGNPVYYHSVVRNPRSTEFLQRIAKGERFDRAVRSHLEKWSSRRWRAIRSVLRHGFGREGSTR